MVEGKIECLECGERGEGEAFDECQSCGSDNTEAIIVTECPNGVTRSDWLASTGKVCDSDIHEWKSGQHIERVELE